MYSSINPEIVRAYSFDWDDNIISMPTTINVVKDGEKISVPTDEYANIRNNPEYSLGDDAFDNFINDSEFLSDLEKAIETKSNKDILLKTLKFYNELHKTTDITNINFIKDGILDNDLVGKYKADYESMTYNDFICMIFGINFELLDELDEFEEKPVSYNRQSLDKVKTLVNNSKNEVADANEAEEDNEEDNAEDNEEDNAEDNAEDNEAEEAAESESEANEANEVNEESEANAEDNEESEAEEDINLPPPPTPTPISTRSQKTPIIPSQTPNSTTDNEKTNVGGKMKMKLMKRKMKL
jgi:hypothetical protein